MNTLIFGNGFIGSRLHGAIPSIMSTKRIHSIADAMAEIDRYQADVVINCIGFTGYTSVDDCELEKSKTLFCNSFIPIILNEATKRTGTKLVHISSGCIYNYTPGSPPITEDMKPDFYNLFYSRSKIYAEGVLDSSVLSVRIRIPLDNRPHPRNILTKLLAFNKVIDVPNSITYIPDFIDALQHLISVDAKGIFNLTNTGGLRYSDLLSTYNHYKEHKFHTMTLDELGRVRTNIILSTAKLRDYGFPIRNINNVLDECVREYLRSEGTYV